MSSARIRRHITSRDNSSRHAGRARRLSPFARNTRCLMMTDAPASRNILGFSYHALRIIGALTFSFSLHRCLSGSEPRCRRLPISSSAKYVDISGYWITSCRASVSRLEKWFEIRSTPIISFLSIALACWYQPELLAKRACWLGVWSRSSRDLKECLRRLSNKFCGRHFLRCVSEYVSDRNEWNYNARLYYIAYIYYFNGRLLAKFRPWW